MAVYRHDGEYVGAPNADTKIYPLDVLIVYGRADTLAELDERRCDWSGQQAHERAVSEQERIEAEQGYREREYNEKPKAHKEAGQ